MKMPGVTRSRQIATSRALSPWMPSHISKARRANTHSGVFCTIVKRLGIDPFLLRQIIVIFVFAMRAVDVLGFPPPPCGGGIQEAPHRLLARLD